MKRKQKTAQTLQTDAWKGTYTQSVSDVTGLGKVYAGYQDKVSKYWTVTKGLVSSIYSTSGSAQGISFALPVESVRDIAEKIIKEGKVSRGWFDFLSVELNSQIVSYCNLSVEKGILVSQVVPMGMADKGGIKGGSEKAQYGSSVIYLGGDVVVAINGRKVEDYTDYFALLFTSSPGDKVDVTVVRNGETVELKGVELVQQTEENTRWILR